MRRSGSTRGSVAARSTRRRPSGGSGSAATSSPTASRHGRLDKPDALLTWSVLDAIRSRVELTAPVPAQARAALVLALDHGISLDAAAYLWLAMSLKLPLLSHDETLARAAAKSAVAVVRLEELA